MRKIKAIEFIAFSYCLYFSITMAVDNKMFDKQSVLYDYFQRINDSEMVWGIASFSVCVVFFFSFLFRDQKWLSIIASVMAGLFFLIVGSAYMITYPNIGSGIFTIIGVACFMNVGYIAIPKNDIQKEVDEAYENRESDSRRSEKGS